ncbi:hypothetical protein RA280_00865 [Cupriavidus sp. CV2]|nr:hypothetical protein [Cupriavidus sp. CV2]
MPVLSRREAIALLAVVVLLYGGVFGIALAYLALTTVNRALPAMATSLGLLGVPVSGSLCSALALGEPLGRPLLGAMAMIVGGVALGIWHPRRRARHAERGQAAALRRCRGP